MKFSKRFIIILGLVQIVCTRIASRHRQYIIDGETTTESELKYVVAILEDGINVCTGGIISENHILTSAHCVIDGTTNEVFQNDFVIVAGAKSLCDPNRIEVKVAEFYVPKIDGVYWSMEKSDVHDIAVLKLKESFDFAQNENVASLKLPQKHCNKNHGKDTIDSNSRIYVVGGFGWDKIERSDTKATGSSSGRLWKGYLKVIEKSECLKFYDLPAITHVGLVCGRSVNGKGNLCDGDSGAPVVPVGEDYVFAVVVGGDFACDDQKIPPRFISVEYYLDFIEDAMADRIINMEGWKVIDE